MKKIGIVTITSARSNSFNYGNILQNYALTEYLKGLGLDVETVYYASTVPEFTLMKQHEKKSYSGFWQMLDDAYRVTSRRIFKRTLEKKSERRSALFCDFINKYISYTDEIYTKTSDLIKLNERYDYFIVGSDQVWNPYYEGANEFYYLGFADRAKRLTYAPSFGVGNIPKEMIDKMRIWIEQIPEVTIREEEGRELLSSVFNVKSTLVVDPVFLLSKDQWQQVAEPAKMKEKYFAVYILGKKTVETKRYIRKLEKRYGIKSIDLYTKDDPNSLFCGPAEFIGLIADAEFVLTDSFHGAAFALIFEHPVVIVDRNASNKKSTYRMSGRIENILKLAGVKDRNVQDVIKNKEDLCRSYSVKGTELEDLIHFSQNYLKHMFERNGGVNDKNK